ncbi:MAG: methylated-DNA--[protein]-cysteine S-methyltransferase [Oligoflexales bacterium]
MRGSISAGSIITPIGWILVHADRDGLRGLDFCGNRKPPKMPKQSNSCIDLTLAQLEAYFQGKTRHFNLPLAPEGTDFQQKVWQHLRRIPWGQSCSYGDIAKSCKNPKASRAVGMANNRNPLPIIIPCHRVVGSNGQLVGYGGGLGIKRWLLQHEGIKITEKDSLLESPFQQTPQRSQDQAT